MLDAIVGVSDAAPVSMQPPWQSALEAVVAPGDLRGLRVAHVADICGIPCEPEIAQACRAAADALASAGATVDDATLDLTGGRESYLALRGQWMVGRHLEYIDSLERLPANLAGNIQDGLNLTMADLARAEWQRAALWAQVVAFFGKWDLMITPTTLVSPFSLQEGPPTSVAGVALASYIDWVAPTFLISLFGLPAASVPCGLTSGGLPIGAQIVGRRFSEPTILRAADFVQRALPIGRPPRSGA